MKVVSAQDMETRRAPEDWVTGVVWIDTAPADQSPDAGVFRVLFEPGARTNWHTHPEGQILYVVTGEGRAQQEGELVVEIGPGDLVYFAPGEKHWHGAGPDTFMVHVAINPANTTSGGTDLLEPVTDEEYSGTIG
ncbi:MAG: Transcriptional regulator [uncultured Rubrobacteraceae bacterium]|uniref:Transcriptional regulator n=1 Tax=uncultured Rubrobacteraceae bacterium TaxID=349277 RepID=A0A6J4PFG7_9ACTN|nr:MAG: Transcriptional regulator [uncultured Rubrobacteraceae bacterium]